MINTDKVKDMTWLAVFEKREGRKVFRTTKYFKRDFIGLHMLKSFIAGTIAFFICFVFWGIFNMENLMATIHTMDIPAFGKQVLLIYVVSMAIYMGGVFAYAQVYYARERRRVKAFSKRLRKIAEED